MIEEIALLESRLAQQTELLRQKEAQLVQQQNIIALLKRSQTNISGMEPQNAALTSQASPPPPPPFPEHLTRSLHRKPAVPPSPPPATRCFAIDPVDLPDSHENARAPCRISGMTTDSSSSIPMETPPARGMTILSPTESTPRNSGLSEDLQELINEIDMDALDQSLDGVLRPSLMKESRKMENERILKQDDRDDLEIRASDMFRDSVLDEMLQEMM